MIKFINLCNSDPYTILKKKYDEALNAGQKNIEAMSISSYDIYKSEVDSRFINLKFIEINKFIFFTNYNSPKSIAFQSHNQISGIFYWSSTNVQIRVKAKISKTTKEFNNKYFKNRDAQKNALAISSKQSKKIKSYQDVIYEYEQVKENDDLMKCPESWGGFYFIPYYFEFWEGNESRINKREIFEKIDGVWEQSFLQP